MLWRFPFGRPSEPWPPMTEETKRRYPALAERFAVADRLILPRFQEFDRRAMRAQIKDRRLQLFLIMGAACTAVFGAIQAVGAVDPRYVGLMLALLAFGTRRVSLLRNRHDTLGSYLVARAKAEELRSLYFVYLAGTHHQDIRELETKVLDIVHSSRTGGA